MTRSTDNTNAAEKYLHICESVPDGDRWEWVYDTPEGANAAARADWEHLTASEKKRQHIYACIVRREWLDDDAIDEDTGEINWACFYQADTFPGAYDSDMEA